MKPGDRLPQRPGVVDLGVGSVLDDVPVRELSRGEIGSLTRLSEEYVFVNPLLLYWVLPGCDWMPLVEARRVTGKPTEQVVIRCPKLIFDYGQRGDELGLPDGNVLFGVPKSEWEAIEPFYAAGVLSLPSGSGLWLRTQRMFLVDPYARNLQEHQIESNTVRVYGLAVQGADMLVFFSNGKLALTVPSGQFSVKTAGNAVGPELQSALRLFREGCPDPLSKAADLYDEQTEAPAGTAAGVDRGYRPQRAAGQAEEEE